MKIFLRFICFTTLFPVQRVYILARLFHAYTKEQKNSTQFEIIALKVLISKVNEKTKFMLRTKLGTTKS